MNTSIDIITNYFCNFSCEYCFLHKLKNIQQVIDIDKLQRQLEEVSTKYTIDGINIYGGEVSLLSLDYLKQLIDLCSKYAQVNVVTNFTNDECNEFLNGENITISTSINEERSCNQQVEHSLLLTDIENLSVIQVVTPSLLIKTPKEVLTHLELFKKTVSFLPYSPAIMAGINYDISNMDFSIFIKNIIDEYKSSNYSFEISNINQLNDVIENKYNPRMSSILFINPFNQYAAVSYQNGLEYFKIFDTLEDWELSCRKESILYNRKCNHCEYYGRCYAEHIKEWRKEDECCGMKSLVKWYEKNIYQNNRSVSTSM
jgi:sulfatase maturation enzyme AslB (radical SAM superfamily)